MPIARRVGLRTRVLPRVGAGVVVDVDPDADVFVFVVDVAVLEAGC